MTASLDGLFSLTASTIARVANDGASPGRHALRNWVVQACIVFAAYFIAGRLAQASAARSISVGPLWPAYGIALAAMLRFGNRMIPAVAASALLVSLHNPVPILVTIGQALSTTLSACCGNWLLRRSSFDNALSRPRDILNLVLLGALASAMMSASLGVATLYLGGIQPYASIPHAWLVYWMGDGTGVLLATPLALAVGRPGFRFNLGGVAEYLTVNALLLVSCFLIFGFVRLDVDGDSLTFSMLPFIMLIAVRFGLLGVSLSTILVVAVAAVATAAGQGPFARNASFTNAALLDIFYAVISLTGITLAALIAQREQAELQRDDLVRRQAFADAQEETNKRNSELQNQLAHLGRIGMLNTLSGTLAHEINQPLAAIRINAESAKHFLTRQPALVESAHAALDDILDDGERANEVLKQARLFLKKATTAREEMDLNPAITDVVKLMHPSALKFGVQLDIRLGTPARPIWADRVQIQQVVTNLLMNAFEAVEQNDKSLRQVRLATGFSADMATVTIADNGPRISDLAMQQLFEPFYTTKPDGMGLGLTICRSIVRAHRGQLSARQNPGGGLTFVATMPFADRAQNH